MAKNPFGNLYKVSSAANWATVAKDHNLAFGHWDSVYKIFADGIEYNIADASAYEKLINDLSTYVHNEVDSSIDNLQADLADLSTNRVKSLETWKAALKLAAADNKISIVGVDGDVTVAGSDYVKVSTADNTISVSIDASVKHADNEEDAKAKLATQGYVDQEVTKAQGNLNDLSTYVHKSVDASIDNLQADVLDLSTRVVPAIDASLKAALKSAEIAATVAENVATVTLSTETEGQVKATDSFTLTGDSFVKVGGADDALTLAAQVSNSKEAIKDASKADNAKLASDYAVKEYVADQLGDIANALTFKGGSTELAAELASTSLTDFNVGDMFVATADGNATVGGVAYTWHNGDSVIVTAVADGKVSNLTIVEQHREGMVKNATADGGALTEDKLVLGADNDNVKASVYGIGADSSHAAAENTVATEKHVEAMIAKEDSSAKAYVDGEVATINERIDNISLSADSSTESYLKIKATENTDDQFAVQAGVVVVNVADATAAGQGLADAFDVKQQIAAAGGTLSGADNSIKLTAADGGALGSVSVKGDDYVIATVADDTLLVDASTCTLVDASKGAKGLAMAEDVAKELFDVEKTISEAINVVKESAGLADTLELSDDFKAKFGDRDMSEAIIDLSTDLKALNSSLDAKISAAIDSSIKLLDVASTEAADKILVGVSETDGKVASTAAALKVNGVAFTHAVGADDMTATISGNDMVAGGSDDKWKDVSVSKAIVDLSTAIDEMVSDAVMSVEGDSVSTTEPTQFVGVSAVEDADHKVTLDSSLLIAANVEMSEGLTPATATGLATDKFVKDYVTEAIAWVEL